MVEWTGENFCAGWTAENNLGVVVVTAKTLEGVKREFEEALEFTVAGWVEDGDDIPGYLKKGDHQIEYVLNAAALLRAAETYTTLAAISRASGIHQKQLSHYVTGLKNPRPAQRERIVAGLHRIVAELLALA